MEKAIKVIIDSDIPFIRGIVEPYASVEYLKGGEFSNEKIANSDALIIRTRTKCNRELLEHTNVKFIASATIGSDHVDLDWCRENGIHFTNAAGCNAWGVVQYVITSIFYLFDKKGESPKGITLGVIGAGNVGERLATLATKLGFNVLRCDPPLALKMAHDSSLSKIEYYDLDYVLRNSDVVSLHVPLDSSTRDMANDSFFSSLKDGAVFINTSRGEVVDEEALINAIDNLSGLVVDVWRDEPNINRDLLYKADISTPHIAGYSIQGKINASVISINNLGRFFNIDPLSGYTYKHTEPQKLTFMPTEDCDPYINLSNLIFSIYDIGEDSKALKESPLLFESLRNGYAYREEYSEEVKNMFDKIIRDEQI